MKPKETFFTDGEIEILRQQLRESVDKAEAARQREAYAIHPRIIEHRKGASLHEATDVLGSRNEAERWLSSPAPAFENMTPMSVLEGSDGLQKVSAVLQRIKHSVHT